MERITDEEIAVLNEARAILKAYSDYNSGSEANEAAVAAVATIAENGIFKFLNWTNAYLHREMTYEQLHNQRQGVTA